MYLWWGVGRLGPLIMECSPCYQQPIGDLPQILARLSLGLCFFVFWNHNRVILFCLHISEGINNVSLKRYFLFVILLMHSLERTTPTSVEISISVTLFLVGMWQIICKSHLLGACPNFCLHSVSHNVKGCSTTCFVQFGCKQPVLSSLVVLCLISVCLLEEAEESHLCGLLQVFANKLIWVIFAIESILKSFATFIGIVNGVLIGNNVAGNVL